MFRIYCRGHCPIFRHLTAASRDLSAASRDLKAASRDPSHELNQSRELERGSLPIAAVLRQIHIEIHTQIHAHRNRHGSVCDGLFGEWGVGYGGGGQGDYSSMGGEWEGVGGGEVEMWVSGCHFLEVQTLKSQCIGRMVPIYLDI